MRRRSGFGWLELITGILLIILGIFTFVRPFRALSSFVIAYGLPVYPSAGQWALSLLFPIWFIAHCISRLTQLDRIRFAAGNAVYYVTLIINLIGLILGFMMVLMPRFSLISVSYVAGIYLLLLGIDSVVLAFSRMGE